MASPAPSGDGTDYSESPSTSRPLFDHNQLSVGPSSQTQHPVSSARYDTANNIHSHPPVYQHQATIPSGSNEHQQVLLPPEPQSSSLYAAGPSTYAINQSYHVPNQVEHQPMQHSDMVYTNHSVPYSYPADESSMWGASIGFGLGEWAQFVDYVQRPDQPHTGRSQRGQM